MTKTKKEIKLLILQKQRELAELYEQYKEAKYCGCKKNNNYFDSPYEHDLTGPAPKNIGYTYTYCPNCDFNIVERF